MSKSRDHDLGQKLRLRTLFFAMGYWSPLEVELSQFDVSGSLAKRSTLTDLDVLAIRYDGLFAPHRIVGDCKTGRNVSDANRLFWLSGVREYFGADQAYFLRPSISPHVRAMAPKLKLNVLSEDDLESIEKSLSLYKFPVPLWDERVYEATSKLWGIDVSPKSKPTSEQLRTKNVYSYLSYTYWYLDARRNILTLIEHFAQVAPFLDEKNPRDVLLAFVGAERFAHCLLDAAAYIHSHGLSDIAKYFRVYIYGGPLDLREKERFFDLYRRVSGTNDTLDPPWLDDVIELLARMLRNPAGASDVLRHLTAMYTCCTLLGSHDVPDFAPNPRNTAAIVFAKDVAAVFARVSGIRSSLYGSIRNI